jgi:hypothetical protein
VAAYAAASFVVVAAVAHLWTAGARTLLRLLGGTAFMLYYWYSAPALAEAYGAPRLGPFAIRATAALLLAVWWWRIVRRQSIAR